jgi:hypothetical protein
MATHGDKRRAAASRAARDLNKNIVVHIICNHLSSSGSFAPLFSTLRDASPTPRCKIGGQLHVTPTLSPLMHDPCGERIFFAVSQNVYISFFLDMNIQITAASCILVILLRQTSIEPLNIT